MEIWDLLQRIVFTIHDTIHRDPTILLGAAVFLLVLTAVMIAAKW